MIRIFVYHDRYFFQGIHTDANYCTQFLYNNYVKEYDTDYGSIRFYSLDSVGIAIRIFITRGSDMFRTTHNFILYSSTSK